MVQSQSSATSSLINLWSATRRQFYHKSSDDRHDHPNVGAQTIAERHKYWKHWYAVSSLDSLPRRQTEVLHLPRTISSQRRHRCEFMHTLQPCTTITSIDVPALLCYGKWILTRGSLWSTSGRFRAISRTRCSRVRSDPSRS